MAKRYRYMRDRRVLWAKARDRGVVGYHFLSRSALTRHFQAHPNRVDRLLQVALKPVGALAILLALPFSLMRRLLRSQSASADGQLSRLKGRGTPMDVSQPRTSFTTKSQHEHPKSDTIRVAELRRKYGLPETTAAMATTEKKCAVCSAVVDQSAIDCPVCGKGVFETVKTRVTDVDDQERETVGTGDTMENPALIPAQFVTHVGVAVTVSIDSPEEQNWWLEGGMGWLFRETNPGLTAGLTPYDQQIVFRTTLLNKATINQDATSVEAARNLLEGADKDGCLVVKFGYFGVSRDDKVVQVGFTVAIVFSPPPGMKPWTVSVAENRTIVASDKLHVARDDGSLAIKDVSALYG